MKLIKSDRLKSLIDESEFHKLYCTEWCTITLRNMRRFRISNYAEPEDVLSFINSIRRLGNKSLNLKVTKTIVEVID